MLKIKIKNKNKKRLWKVQPRSDQCGGHGGVSSDGRVSSAVAEVHLPLPVPLVGVTGLGGKAGGPLTAFDVEGKDTGDDGS
jgi:hypothetical protein